MTKTSQYDIQILYNIADEALGWFSGEPEIMTAKVDGLEDETIYTLVWRVKRNGV